MDDILCPLISNFIKEFKRRIASTFPAALCNSPL